MKKSHRLIILGIFGLAFLITAPAVILATSGYRYNWGKDRLEKTGIIKFVSRPTGAKVWLNGQLLPRTTPMSVFRLLPEDYQIRMEIPGYFEWKKNLEVQSGATTFTEDVVLVRQTSPRPISDLNWASGVWNADGTRLAAVKTASGTEELVVTGADGTGETLLSRMAPGYYQNMTVSWSPDGKWLLIQGNLAAVPSRREVIAYPLPPAEIKPMLLAQTADGGLTAPARWSADGRQVTVISDRAVNVVNLKDDQAAPVPGTVGADDALMVQGRLLTVQPLADGSRLQDISPDGSRPPQPLADLPSGQWRISLAEGNYLLLANSRETQGLLYRLSDGRVFGPWSGSQGAWEKPGGQGRLLLWNDFEISYWDPLTENRTVITRLSSPISQCLWEPFGRNVLFSAGNSILAAEIDGRDGRNTYELNRLTEIGPISLDSSRRQLRFLGAAGNLRGLFQQGF